MSSALFHVASSEVMNAYLNTTRLTKNEASGRTGERVLFSLASTLEKGSC